jgi:GNAT superfamily N-acetyltransferase
VDDLRLARPEDAHAIDALMKASIRDIFPAVYDERQTASAETYISSVDRQLIADATYFVIDEGDELIACGGWSRRNKLYTGSGDKALDDRLIDPATEAARVRAMFVRGDRTRRGLGTLILEACEDAAQREGFTRMILMATMPGLPLYERFGFTVTSFETITMPDDVRLAGALMERPIHPA